MNPAVDFYLREACEAEELAQVVSYGPDKQCLLGRARSLREKAETLQNRERAVRPAYNRQRR